VYVVEMRLKIVLITNGVLPIPALPDRLLTLSGTTLGSLDTRLPVTQNRTSEGRLDEPQAHGLVAIALGQRAKQVDVVRENHLGIQRERMACSHLADRAAKQIDGTDIGEYWCPLVRNEREEIRGTRN